MSITKNGRKVWQNGESLQGISDYARFASRLVFLSVERIRKDSTPWPVAKRGPDAIIRARFADGAQATIEHRDFTLAVDALEALTRYTGLGLDQSSRDYVQFSATAFEIALALEVNAALAGSSR